MNEVRYSKNDSVLLPGFKGNLPEENGLIRVFRCDKFLLYLDLESLFLRKPERARSYRRMSEEDRKATLERFKDELKQQTVDRDILVIPTSFEIIHTGYTAFEATVIVTEKFQYPDYTEVKRYTYTLQRQNKIWIISDYEIQNLGTE